MLVKYSCRTLFLILVVVFLTGCDENQKMKNVTVRIDGRVPGSGVIIRKDSSSYYVLVAKHTIVTKPGAIDTPYSVITVDGKSHQIEYQQIEADKNIDLAIVKFDNKEEYSVAEKSDRSPDKDVSIFISGWKNCVTSPIYEITAGKIVEKETSDLSDADKKDGYQIKYTNPTASGMSGSPIFDENAKLIAIHGMPGIEKGSSTNYNLSTCPPLEKSNAIVSSNFGIPLKIFLDSSIGKKFGN